MATISSTGSISSAGIGSNLPVDDIVKSQIAVERRPIDLLKKTASQYQTSLSSYGKMQGVLATLRDAAAKLSNTEIWNTTSATSSDANAVSATTTTSASPGSYSVAVQALATSQMGASSAFEKSTSTLGQGTLHISLGTWVNTPADPDNGIEASTTFNQKTGSTTLDISIGPGEDTLEKVRDKINGAGAGITASIVNDSTGARLAIKSSSTGLDNGFRIAVDNAGGSLNSLAYDPQNGIADLALKQPAANAKATINGVDIESASNTLTDVIDGLNISLGKVTSSNGVATPVNITVAQDTATINKAITDYAAAYSAVSAFLKEQTKYDQKSNTAGPLQGDRTATSLISQLRSSLSGTSTASSVFKRLADIGLDPVADGSLKVNTTKLTSALGNLAEVKKMFTDSSTDTSQQGLGVRMRKLTDSILGVNGAVTNAQDGLNRSVSDNNKQQARLEDQVAAKEKRLRAQYTALDKKMGSLNGLSTYMTQQLAQFNKS